MKKIFSFLILILFVAGCSKSNDKNLVNNLNKKIEKCESYRMTATLEIYRNEEKYVYNIESSYQENNLFRVDLLNQNNNHKQVILKNNEGVYVITPSLNKSFKFQSDWPYNNSQIYLLQPIVKDIVNDSERIIEKVASGYIIKSKVNYSTEKDYRYQKVYIDNENNISKVEIIDNNDTIKICLTVIDIDYNNKFEKNYFSLENYNDNNLENNTQLDKKSDDNLSEKDNNKLEEEKKLNSSSLDTDEIIYPMYVPVDTYLTAQDVINTPYGERVILTFNGKSNFTIVQEKTSASDIENYINGDPYLILDTVGSITDYSVSWISDNIEYSILSDNMDIDELLTVAQSISVKTVSK